MAYVFDSPRMVMNGGGGVVVVDVAAATVFAIIHVVFVEVYAVARDCWMLINVRGAIESPDLEC